MRVTATAMCSQTQMQTLSEHICRGGGGDKSLKNFSPTDKESGENEERGTENGEPAHSTATAYRNY